MSSLQLTPEMLAGPAMMPPPGITPNLVNPYTIGPTLIGVGAMLLAMMLAFVTARLATKAFIVCKFSWDDLTCMIGTLFTIAYFATCVVGVVKGKYGTHLWDVTLETFSSDQTAICDVLFSVLTPPALYFIKITFFILFLHLFHPKQGMRTAIYIGLVFTTVFYFIAFILAFVASIPRPGETILSHEEFNPSENLEITASIWLPTVGMVIDLYIIALPLYGVSTLHLPLRRKIIAGSGFLTGIIAVLASILSLVYRIRIYYNPLDDLTYNLVPPLITSLVEMNLGLLITCIPSLMRLGRHTQPGLSRLRSRLLSTFTSTHGSTGRDGRSHGSGASGSKPSSSDGGFVGAEAYEIHGVKGAGRRENYVGHGDSNGDVGEGIERRFDIKVETRAGPMEREREMV